MLKLRFSSLPLHSVALSATGASLIALLMIFTLHPQGLEEITSQHTWQGSRAGLHQLCPTFFPSARAQGFLHRDSTFLRVLQLLLEPLPGHCDLFPALGFLAAASAKALMNDLPP